MLVLGKFLYFAKGTSAPDAVGESILYPAESFKGGANVKPIKEAKGSSSKVVASTKPANEEVISEGAELKNRFKKLANIL